MSMLFLQKNAITKEESDRYFNYLKYNVVWEEGIRSRRYGFTRKAKTLSPDDDLFNELLIGLIKPILIKINKKDKDDGGNTNLNFMILGMYLNYYENGNHFTPTHSHQDSYQLVISLGVTRTLKIKSVSYRMEKGDAILFGNQSHTVPRETGITGERISIATFMKQIPEDIADELRLEQLRIN